MLPFLENKVAIPAGIFMGVPPLKAWVIASTANTAIMPLLATAYRNHPFRRYPTTKNVTTVSLEPVQLKQMITDRLELLLADLRDPLEYISPRARKEARSLVSSYMNLAWDLTPSDMAKLESQWTDEFRSVDEKKSKTWSLLSPSDHEVFQGGELLTLEAVKAELSIEAVALDYAQEFEELRSNYEKILALDEDSRPEGWESMKGDMALYDKIGKVVERMMGSESEWATVQREFRAWHNANADEREEQRLKVQDDWMQVHELIERGWELEYRIDKLEEEKASDHDVE